VQNQRFDPSSHYAIQHQPPLANTSQIRRKYLDISYAARSASQKLDVYLPAAGAGPFPVIVSIHGGAFMGLDKADEQVLPMLAGLERGYAVVSVNYRLSWEAVFPALVHDVKTAVRWVRANAGRYGFDPGRIAAWGGSAGGYLALMLGVTGGRTILEDLDEGYPDQSSGVQAIVDWFGPTDFLKMDEQLTAGGMPPFPGQEHSGENSPESLLLGAKITKIPEKVVEANPETYIHPQAAPALIQHGDRDPVVPVQQSIGMAEKLSLAIGSENAVLEVLDGAGHSGPQFETPENLDRIFAFLDRRLA